MSIHLRCGRKSLTLIIKKEQMRAVEIKHVSSQGQKRKKNNGWCRGGSVTLHVNDRSAAGSAGSPPHRYAFVCIGSKASPTQCDRPTLTDWQGKHAPQLFCCAPTR